MANNALRKGRGKHVGPELAEVPPAHKEPPEETLFTSRRQQQVNAPRLKLDVLPKNQHIPAGLSLQFTALEMAADGTTRDATDDVFWKSTNTEAVTITDTGLATAVKVGHARILASTEVGIQGSTEVHTAPAVLVSIAINPSNTSVAAGLQKKFTAQGTYSDNRTRDLTNSVGWSSSPGATVDTTGLATGTTPGPVTITATLGTVSATTQLNVTPAQLLAITVSPPNPSVAAGLTQQFKASGVYSDGTNPDITNAVAWTSTPSATIDASGLATGVTAGGQATITAAYGGFNASTTLTVTPPALAYITVLPQNQTLAIGQTQQFTATGTYSDNTSKDLTGAVAWNSSSGAATINGAGLATGVAAGGPFTITATSGAISGNARLTISPALQSIAVTPQNPTVAAGKTQQLTATATFSDGSSKDLTSISAWTSSAPAVATVSAQGLATAIATGPVTISASAVGIIGSTTLTVAPASVQSIAVLPARAALGAEQTRQFTAIATLSDGSTQDVTTSTNWSSSDTSVATIDNTGMATGGRFGVTTITASYTDSNNNSFQASQVLQTLLNFADLGDADTQAFSNAKSLINQLLTAFERRGNLSDDETTQLQNGLELVTQFLNNNPSVQVPDFNAATKAGNNVSDLTLLGIKWNADRTKGPVGTGSKKSNVIDDRFRAICDYLYSGKTPPGVEHDPGSFPFANGPNPGGLSDEQVRVAAVYGYVLNSGAVPPQYKPVSPVTPDDKNRRDVFNKSVEAADSHFRTNRALYVAALTRFLQNNQAAQINVLDWAKVVAILAQGGITASNPQLNTEIDRALAIAQNVGQDAPPSQIDINLPDLEQDVSDFEIISENIFALQPAYFCSMLEELKVFQVVDKLVELFQNGILPVVKGEAGNLLFKWWQTAALRISESERRAFYARSLGFPGGDADSPNREFKDLFMRFVSAVSSFVRQNTVDNLLRSNIPGAISQQQVRKSARDLATNISAHGYGIAYPMATELQKELKDVMAILKNNEVEDAYGAKDMWQLVDQVAALELGGAKNSVKYRTMASAGATVFAWLANKARLLASNSYVPILDLTQLQNPPSYSTNPTVKPSDFDLVGACDQWLAVTGTQEDSVERAAQPIEAPVIPSRPIQIPSVARDMLESVGVPAMAYAAGKPNGSGYPGNWRFSNK